MILLLCICIPSYAYNSLKFRQKDEFYVQIMGALYMNFTKKKNTLSITKAYTCIYIKLPWLTPIISSPEHEVKVSYCGQSMSVVRRAASTIA